MKIVSSAQAGIREGTLKKLKFMQATSRWYYLYYIFPAIQVAVSVLYAVEGMWFSAVWQLLIATLWAWIAYNWSVGRILRFVPTQLNIDKTFNKETNQWEWSLTTPEKITVTKQYGEVSTQFQESK